MYQRTVGIDLLRSFNGSGEWHVHDTSLLPSDHPVEAPRSYEINGIAVPLEELTLGYWEYRIKHGTDCLMSAFRLIAPPTPGSSPDQALLVGEVIDR